MLGPKIDDKHILQHRAEQGAEGLVIGVIQIRVAIRLAFEAQNETVREAFGVFFGTHVGAPLVAFDLWYCFLQAPKGVFNRFDLIGRRRGLEFERHDVEQFRRTGWLVGCAHGQAESQGERAKEQLKDVFHRVIG